MFTNDICTKHKFHEFETEMPRLLNANGVYGNKNFINACKRALDEVLGAQLAWEAGTQGQGAF